MTPIPCLPPKSSAPPDEFLLKHLPKDPRHIHNQTLSWIGKTSWARADGTPVVPECCQRYSAHCSPIKSTTSSLLTSRNQTNERCFFWIEANENPLIRIRKGTYSVEDHYDPLEDKMPPSWEQLRRLGECPAERNASTRPKETTTTTAKTITKNDTTDPLAPVLPTPSSLWTRSYDSTPKRQPLHRADWNHLSPSPTA